MAFAPITAANLSAPSVWGVLYKFLMGTGVSCVSLIIGKSQWASCCNTVSLSVTTDETIPRRIGYFWHNIGSLSSVWLQHRITSNGSPCSKTASLATVFPMSMIKFTIFVGFADAKLH